MSLPELRPEVIEKLIRMGPPPSYFDDAFTERVLKQMNEKGLLRSTKRDSKKLDPDTLKYSYLVKIIKKESPKAKLPYSMKVVVGKNLAEIEKKLLDEKLLASSKGKEEGKAERFAITDLGRRFVADYEESQKTGK